MSTTLRRATADDAALLAAHRAAVWEEVGDWSAAAMQAQRPIWAAYFRAALADETYVGFLAEDEYGVVLASGAILIVPAIPRPGSPSCRAGRVQSLFVIPKARRRGFARAVMEHLLAYAREADLIVLNLHPSEDARDLYTALGFTAADEMSLPLLSDHA